MAGSTQQGVSGPPIGRRTFLRGVTATLPLASSWPGGLACAHPPGGDKKAPPGGGGAGGLIVREKEPENLEMPFQTLDSFLTPNEKFYVRNHFAAPKLQVNTWRLKVEGAVERTLELSYAAVTKLRRRTQVALLECVGNGRAFLRPKAQGVPWEFGAVGNAEWAGVPL